jgi:hypothetical protein
LSSALKTSIPALRQSLPLTRHIAAYARRSLPSTELAARLYENLQRHGFVENFLSVVYYVTASLARFDSTSHMLPLFLIGPHNGRCSQYAKAPVHGCGAHYGTQPAYQPERDQALQNLAGYLFR